VAGARRCRGVCAAELSERGGVRVWAAMAGYGAQREARARFKESRAGIAALGSGKGIPAGSPVISGAR